MDALQLFAYEDAAAFETLRDEWNALLKRTPADNIFSTWEWQSTWWNVYGGGTLWLIALRNSEGRLVGLAPWFIEHRPDGERVVRSVGCVDVTDYVDIIVESEYASAVYDRLAAHLVERGTAYDRVNLCNVPEKSTTLHLFRDSLARCGFDVEIEFQEVCPVIRLPGEWEAYLESLDKKNRHEIRRKLRRAENEAETRCVIIGQDDDLDAALDRFLRLMANSQKQKAEFLQNPLNVEFFRKMAAVTHANGWLQLTFLTMNGEDTAAYVNFDYGGGILVYNSGLQPESYGHLSPGIVLLAQNIRHAIETGHTVYDFLRGNETYKYRMGAEDTRVFKVKATLRPA